MRLHNSPDIAARLQCLAFQKIWEKEELETFKSSLQLIRRNKD